MCLGFGLLDICGSFPTAFQNDHEYFITFADNYLVMGTYTFHEKSQSLDKFKSMKLKINRIERLKPLDLTVVVSTTVDTTDQVDVHDLLPIF